MHKYDKRFTGGNQIAYENKYKLPYRRITNPRHCWGYIRQQFRQLSQEEDEDVWDYIVGETNPKQEFIDYY